MLGKVWEALAMAVERRSRLKSWRLLLQAVWTAIGDEMREDSYKRPPFLGFCSVHEKRIVVLIVDGRRHVGWFDV